MYLNWKVSVLILIHFCRAVSILGSYSVKISNMHLGDVKSKYSHTGEDLGLVAGPISTNTTKSKFSLLQTHTFQCFFLHI